MGSLPSKQLPTAASNDSTTFGSNQEAPASKKRRLTRDEQADAELYSFLSELQAERSRSRNRDPPSPTPPATQSGTPATDDDTSASLYPDTMVCSQVLNMAYDCQSVGGQFINIYRYGKLRNCSPLWAQWRLCMRSKSYSDEERRKMVQEYYREKAAKYKVGPSSEDIWETRTESIEGAFQGDFEGVERAWKEQEEKQGKSGKPLF
ncbi:MAG: hypothetical protein M1834_001947 [Cirrosporium novae-zelandiae]|nr:MAG: hypothetical protein M1834_001947 [Cirrosporium novae-zelandiae]